MAKKKNAFSMLVLEGFDDFLEDIQKAEKGIDKATEKCVKSCADVVDEELRKSLQKATNSGLAQRQDPPEITKENGIIKAHVGFHKGTYNPNNISDGYKALFLNFGTPTEAPRKYITKAKRNAKKKVKAKQEEALKDILGDLE